MDDLISRQAALDALEWKWAGKAAIDAIKNLPTAEPTEEQVKEYCRRRNLALIASEDMKTIRQLFLPAEPRKGRWLCSDDMYETAICFCCGWDSREAWENIRKWFKYCPNCGARMTEEEHGKDN